MTVRLVTKTGDGHISNPSRTIFLAPEIGEPLADILILSELGLGRPR